MWEKGLEILCPDGEVRIGHPAIAGWLGDYPEYIKLFTASYGSCPVCIAPKDQLDAHSTTPITHRDIPADEFRKKVMEYNELESKRENFKRNSKDYKEMTAQMAEINDFFDQQRTKRVDNLLFRTPHTSPLALWKPDLLHTIDLGLTKHCLELLFNMLDELSSKKKTDPRRLTELFDITWTAVSPHPAINVPKKKYRSVKQWSGKEYRNAAAIMLAVLEAVMTVYPPDGPAQEDMYNASRNFISALNNFTLMARQRSHTLPPDQVFDNAYRALWDGYAEPDSHSSVSYMQTYLASFHEWKYVFLKYRASKTVTKDAKAYAKGKFPDLNDEDLKGMTPAQRNAKQAAHKAGKKAAKVEYLERHSSYNMPKVHMMVHFAEVIHVYGALPQFSTSIIELLHQPLNLAYDRSNKVDAMDQTLRFAGWKDAMSVRVANLLYHCKKANVSEDVLAQIRLWLDLFDNKKAKLAAARLNRDRMKPKRASAERKAQKAAQDEDTKELARELRKVYGIVAPDDEDSDSDSEDDDAEQDASDDILDLTTIPPSSEEASFRERLLEPGRLLRGRMLTIVNDEGVIRSFLTMQHVESYLRINGLVRALIHCLRLEKIHGTISDDVIPGLEASPFLALRIRRPVFQSEELENHIIRCTAGENFRNSLPRADFVVYEQPRHTFGGEVPVNPIMGTKTIGKLKCFFRVRFPPPPGKQPSKSDYLKFAAIHPMVQEKMTAAQKKRAMPIFKFSEKELIVVRIGAISCAACVVPIGSRRHNTPTSPAELWSMADRVVFNTKVDLDTFHAFY